MNRNLSNAQQRGSFLERMRNTSYAPIEDEHGLTMLGQTERTILGQLDDQDDQNEIQNIANHGVSGKKLA